MAQFRKDTHQFLNDGRTIFETIMLADQYGNIVGAANPSGMAVDAFGRARVSNPITLFDSYNRYDVTEKFHTSNTATGTYVFNANAATVSLNVDTTSGAEVIRESKRVFSYQPGKSLSILNTFIMNEPKTNLRQRAGYFSSQNGIFLEQDGDTISFVKRSYSTGAVVETKISQENWNIDTLDGTGPSQLTLDLTKAQILFIDVEWLGLGTVRCGFVINGQMIHCHSFHHANVIETPYMTTACLPIRYEIKNSNTTSSNSTLQTVCSSVISEGGYEIRGKPRSAGRPANNTFTMATAGIWYPIVSIRLKSSQLDAIVLPTGASAIGEGNNSRVKYGFISGGTLGGNTTFTSVSSDSSVEYNYVANSITGGTVLSQGFLGITTQSSGATKLDGNIFKYQLTRNSFTSTPEIFTLAMQAGTANDVGTGSLDWEEVT